MELEGFRALSCCFSLNPFSLYPVHPRPSTSLSPSPRGADLSLPTSASACSYPHFFSPKLRFSFDPPASSSSLVLGSLPAHRRVSFLFDIFLFSQSCLFIARLLPYPSSVAAATGIFRNVIACTNESFQQHGFRYLAPPLPFPLPSHDSTTATRLNETVHTKVTRLWLFLF